MSDLVEVVGTVLQQIQRQEDVYEDLRLVSPLCARPVVGERRS